MKKAAPHCVRYIPIVFAALAAWRMWSNPLFTLGLLVGWSLATLYITATLIERRGESSTVTPSQQVPHKRADD